MLTNHLNIGGRGGLLRLELVGGIEMDDVDLFVPSEAELVREGVVGELDVPGAR